MADSIRLTDTAELPLYHWFSSEERRAAAEELKEQIAATLDGIANSVKDVMLSYAPRPAKLADVFAGLRHLAWLLGLSDAERSFVDAAATATQSGDLSSAYEMLMVFADWLEDQGRVKDGVEIRRLVPQNGDVIQLIYRKGVPLEEARDAARQLGTMLREHLAMIGRDVLFVAGPEGWELEKFPDDDMRRLGWVRLEESTELSRELQGQPEQDGSGSLICTKLLKMIRRLKSESAALRGGPGSMSADAMRQLGWVRADIANAAKKAEVAEAVRQEREACAKACEELANTGLLEGFDCAETIRNRPPV